jgi:hypothetical protein
MTQHRQGAILALLITALVLLLPAAIPRQARAEALAAPDLPQTALSPQADQGQRLAAGGRLEQRRAQWPAWHLPAPLPRANQRNQAWPAWFAGDWRVSSAVLADGRTGAEDPGAGELSWTVRFRADGHGGAVADRAFNARAIGRALLGEQLLAVQDDPSHPDRQLSRLSGDRLLETTVLARAGERPGPDLFLNDELNLQVLHRSGLEPRVSQVETLGRWQRRADGGIEGEQWQARYPSPAAGLLATPVACDHLRLTLEPLKPQTAGSS